jgi:hypothetical protein
MSATSPARQRHCGRSTPQCPSACDAAVAAGHGRTLCRSGRYVETDAGRRHFPSLAEVPPLMGDFAQWLGAAPATPETAFTAHRHLVEIHPFNDGNGRTARLLMNLVLLRGGIRRSPCAPKTGLPISVHCRWPRPDAAAKDSTVFYTKNRTQRWRSR